MDIYWNHIIFVVSFICLMLFLFLIYQRGKRRGLKKALYRITYTSLCMVIAFLVSPYINEYILNYDLYQAGKAIQYNGLHFYRIIDFIEEIIVHNEVLNDIYNLIPSLKNLLMDFPQVLFLPFTYVLTFLLFKLLLLPLYLFLSYKRKRRILYEKTPNKASKTFAGILSVVHCVFLISIVLTPINGLSRIYKNSSAIIDDNSNICNQNEYLKKYESACLIIEGYNSSVFGIIRYDPISEYVYDSLTRISYGDNETTLSKEVVSLVKAGIILNKTGLLNAINVKEFSDVTKLNFHQLTTTDIDIIVEAFEQSLYTKEVVYDVYDWSKSYLDWLLKDMTYNYIDLNYEYQDIISELKIILTTINYILNNEAYLSNLAEVYSIIDKFSKLPVSKRILSSVALKFFFDICYTLDLDSTIELYSLLKDSKIYNDVIPQMLDNILSLVGIHTDINSNSEELHVAVYYGLNIAKIVYNHRYTNDILKIVSELTIDELHYIGKVIKYLNESQTMNQLLYDLTNFALEDIQLKLDIPTEVIKDIKEWERELELAQIVIQIIYTKLNDGYIDFDKALYGLQNYSDTILFDRAFKYLIDILPEIFVTWITGKGFDYLVGEYV